MPKLKTLRIAIVPGLPSLPIYIADDQKLFQKYGLKPKLENLGADFGAAVKGVAAGKYDLTSVASFLVYATEIQSPGTFVVLSHDIDAAQYPCIYALVGNKDAGIKSIADLTGKKLGIFPTPPTFENGSQLFEGYARALIRSAGINPSDVEIVVPDLSGDPSQLIAQQIGALAQGHIHAYLTLEPIAAIAVTVGAGVYVDRSALTPSVLEQIPMGAFIASRKRLKKRPKFVRRISCAIDEAIDYIRKHSTPNVYARSMDAIYLKYGVIPPNIPVAVAGISPILHFWKRKEIDISVCQKYADHLAAENVISKKLNVKPLYQW
jgi:ABC-type nitrate/sulfonate/bicarbonate transport system substrate-binding protein